MVAQPIKQLEYDGAITYHSVPNVEAKKCPPVTCKWSEMVTLLTTAKRTPETMKEWKALSGERQTFIKDVGGFIGGLLDKGVRGKNADNVSTTSCRTLLTFDADKAAPGLWERYCLLYGNAAVLYPTHSSTPADPHLRLIIPLQWPINVRTEPELYRAVAEAICDDLGAAQFDSCSYLTTQIMFLPSTPSDAPWEPKVCDGPWFDVLAWVNDNPDWKDQSTWPEDTVVRQAANKLAGDPLLKPGVIGEFCRAHSIEEAVDELLDDVYRDDGKPNRRTRIGASTANGLMLFPAQELCYSVHHNSDIACDGHSHNAFDIVRIHKFGNTKESQKQMEDFARADAHVVELEAAEAFAAEETLAVAGTSAPRPMFFHFDVATRKQVFVPALMAAWYQRLQPCVVFADLLYRYDSGKYVPAKQHFMAAAAQALGQEWSSFRANETHTLLMASSPVRREPWGEAGLLNVKNGLIDMDCGLLIPHSPSRCGLVQIPWDYAPDAPCPVTTAFFEEFAPGQAHLVWSMLGYTLLETLRFEKSFILLGVGSNGKGTTLELVNKLLGAENVSHVALHTLEENIFAGAGLVGKLANVQSDLPVGLIEAKGVFKTITSGDAVSVVRKGKDAFDAYIRAKMMFSANELSASKDTSFGYYRKWCIISFPKIFDGVARRAKLFTEMPGILAKAVEYALRLQEMKSFPESVGVEEYRLNTDHVYAFFKESMQSGGSVSKSECYMVYRQDCFAQGNLPVSMKRFGMKLASLGVKESRTMTERLWVDVHVLADNDAL